MIAVLQNLDPVCEGWGGPYLCRQVTRDCPVQPVPAHVKTVLSMPGG
jgi:hypothetical protein